MTATDFYVTVAQIIPVLLLGVTIESGMTRAARHSRSMTVLLGLGLVAAFIGEITALAVIRQPAWSSTITAGVCQMSALYLLGVLCGGLFVRIRTD